MATIEPYSTKDGERRYMVRYRTPEGRQTMKRGFTRKIDAKQWLEDNESSMRRGEYVSPRAGRTTVKTLADKWAETRPAVVRPKTWDTESTLLNSRVLPRWGAVQVGRVTPSAVQAWAGELTGAGLSPSTVRACVSILSRLLRAAVADRALASNPCDGITLPKRAPRPRAYLDARQVARLADAAGPWHDVIQVLAWTGLRVGELAALRVSDADTARRRLSVTKTASELGGKIVEGPTKTGAGTRSVPYPRFLAAVVERAREGRRPGEYLFTSPAGGQVRAANLRNRGVTPASAVAGTAVTALQGALEAPQTGTLDAGTLQALRERLRAVGAPVLADNAVIDAAVWDALGLDQYRECELRAGDRDFPALTVHDLRHTAASLAISAGANVKAVQTMLGHASAAMTLDTYADLFPDDLDAVADALDALARGTGV
ncbi:site-specific integrase [uncultured Actinomyces sp.]|uniref:tyrosine-type recombinase/integrase n=1 Tax=uncultured Actinomyces sp. TaxID=249061 RepID=UPI00280526FB|nr:site-specific integrase [uncultured Actinomyces sp.]